MNLKQLDSMYFRYFSKFIDITLDLDSESALIVHVNAVLN